MRTGTVGTSCGDPNRRQRNKVFATFEAIVNAYIRDYRNKALRGEKFYKIQRTLSHAIEKAALSKEPSGKRHGHQRRIPGNTLVKWNKSLQLRVSDIKKCRDFEHLLEIHRQEGVRIKGIGKLTVYDTAQRIGTHLGISPKRVYLHAGTKIGATALGIGRGRESLLPEELPKAFRRLQPAEIEDCLCIYKEAIKKLVRAV